jgi:glutamate-1-semialdehyde 2,1-aminomutase
VSPFLARRLNKEGDRLMGRPLSKKLFQHSKALIPGGVNSPVRAFGGVGGTPVFMERGCGPLVYDVDGNQYIDYVGSWGPLILGHAHQRVLHAVQEAASRGFSFGCPTEGEWALARKISEAIPSIEVVRLVNSGTEATMSAVRLARGYTGRDKIIKFEGCYHGHVDALLVEAGSGVATLSIPGTPGIPQEVVKHTLTCGFNDTEQVAALFQEHGAEIAAIIVEPVAGNMGCILPKEGFLPLLRTLCDENGALLIFDEVMTGFRVHWGGAQTRFGVRPDLTTLGKVIGGGLPVGAYGGKEEIMRLIAPDGPVYQAGTLSGNPLAVAAGMTTLQVLSEEPGVYERLEILGSQLVDGLVALGEKFQVPISGIAIGAMFGVSFSSENAVDYSSAKETDVENYAAFFHGMLDRGIYFAPSAFEAGFMSTTHLEEHVETTLFAADEVLSEIISG